MKKRTTKTNQPAARTKRTRPSQQPMPKVVRNLLPTKTRKAPASGFAKPSAAAVERYCNIPLLFEESSDSRTVKGRTVYDSWADGPAMALRDSADGHIRRLKLKAGNLVLEIVAEQRDNVWEFVARVYDGKNAINSFVLKVGGRSFLPQTGGFFIWSSR
ncbi:MAG: hypothetical protein OEV80_13040, partial [candidate division Zixibacteria bacterium]|nr:hypothetical protein [candidate division Zixibacteria bacterium]